MTRFRYSDRYSGRLLGLLLLVLLPTLTVVAVAGAEDPPPEKTVLMVEKRIEGLTIAQWHSRAVRNRKTINRQRRAIRQMVGEKPFGGNALERAFLCVKSFEGAWTSNTGNGYFGGMQMDRQFQRTYGPEFLRAWGTANRWPRSVQLTVAMRAYLSGRGFHPWPNTARMCGLL